MGLGREAGYAALHLLQGGCLLSKDAGLTVIGGPMIPAAQRVLSCYLHGRSPPKHGFAPAILPNP